MDVGKEIGVCVDVEDCVGVESEVLVGFGVDEVVESEGEGVNKDGIEGERLRI